MPFSIDLEQALRPDQLQELRELLSVWRHAQEQLAHLTLGHGPDSVDYANLVEGNPELQLRITLAVNTLKEVWAEVAVFMIPVTTALIVHLSGVEKKIPLEWERHILATVSNDPEFRRELMEMIAELRR